ncbi:uncharacterized protein LOC133193404 [Saccostrea echinata]|uniref:uncharacterized protein LOC133193404 n=1 Tax=Saccostrea echinata TaxID=191078 RepID=UPI002A809454|nr:uncharacterized protein LOC133193404 [Saccostrea echinata]
MNKNETVPVKNYTTMNVNESLIQSTFVNNKISLSEYGNYTAIAIGEKTAMITFIIRPQRKPFAPKDVRVTCEIHSANVIWTSNLNGGSTQNFSIKYKSLNDRNYQEYKKVALDQGKGHKMNVTVDNLMQASEYVFVVIARNNFGATDSTEMPNCTTGYIQTSVQKPNIGGIIGGTVGGIFCIILVLIFIAINRKYQINCVVSERNPNLR